MLGKFIILGVGLMFLAAFLHKMAARFGLIKPRPHAPVTSRLAGSTGFRLTKFNIAMLCLVALYLLWGATQIMR